MQYLLISQSLQQYDFDLIQRPVIDIICYSHLQKQLLGLSFQFVVIKEKSLKNVHCADLFLRGEAISSWSRGLSACHHLPDDGTVWMFTKEVHLDRVGDTDVSGEFQNKAVMMIWIDVFTLHWSRWIVDHWIDMSIDGSLCL